MNTDNLQCPGCAYQLSFSERVTLNLAGMRCPSCKTITLIESRNSRIAQVLLLLVSFASALAAFSSYQQYGFDPVTFTLVVGWLLGIIVLVDLKVRSTLHIKQ